MELFIALQDHSLDLYFMHPFSDSSCDILSLGEFLYDSKKT